MSQNCLNPTVQRLILTIGMKKLAIYLFILVCLWYRVYFANTMKKILLLLFSLSCCLLFSQGFTVSLGNDTTICNHKNIYPALSGGAPPYTYTWFNGGNSYVYNGSSSAYGTYYTQLGGGMVSILATDAVGNTATDTVQINLNLLTVNFQQTPNCVSPPQQILIKANLSNNATPPVSYQWTNWINSSTSDTFSTNSQQYIFLTITDSLGCMRHDSIWPYMETPPVVNLIQQYVCSSTKLLDNAYVGNTSSSFLWNTGQTTPNITITQLGTYILAETNVCGTASDTIQVTAITPPFNVAVTGAPGCIGTSPAVLSANAVGGLFPYIYTWSINTIGVNTSSSSITVLQPASYTVYVKSGSCDKTLSGVVSPCANASYVQGTVFVDNNLNGILDVVDYRLGGVQVSSTMGPSTAISNQNGYYFMVLDTLVSHQLNAANWNAMTPNPLSAPVYFPNGGMSQTQNFYYPPPPFDDLEVYLGVNSVVQPNTQITQFIDYKNVGTTIQNALLVLTASPLVSCSGFSIPPTATNGNTYSWTFNQLAPYSPNSLISFQMNVGGLSLGTQFPMEAYIYPLTNDNTPNNNLSVRDVWVAASYDPNDKQVYPEGDIDIDEVPMQDWQTYTVRFQNVGNAPAKDVVVLDTLSDLLEIESLQLLASSHNYWASIENGVLVVKYMGIYLPDSTHDEPNSHGYFIYRVRPKANLSLGDSITNSAAIYFDNNAPVITNTTVKRVSDLVGLAESQVWNVQVFPNPVAGKLNIRLNRYETVGYEIWDIVGKKCAAGWIQQGTAELPVAQLGAGTYTLVLNEGGIQYFVKWVKQ